MSPGEGVQPVGKQSEFNSCYAVCCGVVKIVMFAGGLGLPIN